MLSGKTDTDTAQPAKGGRLWGRRGSAAATIAAGLSFCGVSKQFGEMVAVNSFSLDIPPGVIVCLLGPSGCGKTTLLRMAAGIEQPTGGRILMNDREISGPNRFIPPEKRHIGLMFQDFALFPHLTILNNVAFGLKALGPMEAKREARAALERVGLLDYAGEYPHILSGGEQQRVALARAIAPRPGVLLMDEPFSGLDARLRDAIREETLTILHETRATCVIVTHHPEEAMRMGDRIAIMRAGELMQVGTAEELYKAPGTLFVARMFSEINEISSDVKGGEVETPLGRFVANGFSDGENAVLCVRHNTVKVGASDEGRPGRVTRAKFLGDAALLEIIVEGLESPLFARVREDEAPAQGAVVGVRIDPQKALVFAQDEG